MSHSNANRRARGTVLAVGGALVLAAMVAAPAGAASPIYRESEAYTDRFPDDVILELCGIETWTTLKERWTFSEYADGSTRLQVVRTFIPDDPRIPIEKGAASSFNAADGSRVVVGSPTRLTNRRGGGTIVVDAGRAVLDANGELVEGTGKAGSFTADFAELYCP